MSASENRAVLGHQQEAVTVAVDEADVSFREKMADEANRTKLLFCAAGIFVCYFYYGILQEKM